MLFKKRKQKSNNNSEITTSRLYKKRQQIKRAIIQMNSLLPEIPIPHLVELDTKIKREITKRNAFTNYFRNEKNESPNESPNEPPEKIKTYITSICGEQHKQTIKKYITIGYGKRFKSTGPCELYIKAQPKDCTGIIVIVYESWGGFYWHIAPNSDNPEVGKTMEQELPLPEKNKSEDIISEIVVALTITINEMDSPEMPKNGGVNSDYITSCVDFFDWLYNNIKVVMDNCNKSNKSNEISKKVK